MEHLHCSSKKDVSILVPGAGLARLMFDIAKLGKMEFWSVGHYVSFNMIYDHGGDEAIMTKGARR